jgi:hypothetical protein
MEADAEVAEAGMIPEAFFHFLFNSIVALDFRPSRPQWRNLVGLLLGFSAELQLSHNGCRMSYTIFR